MSAPSPSAKSETIRPRLLAILPAAAYLSISHWTVRELVWRGELPEVRIGRRLLFDVRDLDGLIERSKRTELQP